VEGRLKLDQWDDKQTNQKRSKLGVVLEAFQFLDSGANREGGAGFSNEGPSDASRQQRPAAPRPAPGAATPPPASEEMPPDAEDDVPF
jgi:single-strand DNA-binding protein